MRSLLIYTWTVVSPSWRKWIADDIKADMIRWLYYTCKQENQ